MQRYLPEFGQSLPDLSAHFTLWYERDMPATWSTSFCTAFLLACEALHTEVWQTMRMHKVPTFSNDYLCFAGTGVNTHHFANFHFRGVSLICLRLWSTIFYSDSPDISFPTHWGVAINEDAQSLYFSAIIIFVLLERVSICTNEPGFSVNWQSYCVTTCWT